MPIATTLNEQLQRYAIAFEYHSHSHSPSSARIAEAAQVPGHLLAKSVVLKRQDDSYLMMVLPADHRVQLGQLHRLLGETVGLATEAEVRAIFTDCDPGALVPTGSAYGLKTLIDRHLLAESEVYIESGDHQNLLRLPGAEFRRLMAGAEQVDASRHL
ncbi:aminoacyl-tRNA deacylase [Marinobacterium rhizophilum]|uniref:YbaK/EbsC family protein n=1 Tax=Marinobacterium rhizophilum TaxID=420402 RepID=A0ABY5HN08_9GAMM|nr:YbaK/EbsC family protein [Marinobacterium rhizophilum]UTW13241.1 YbaK/EbsC family protein [Marinobacterium rhizophilum]